MVTQPAEEVRPSERARVLVRGAYDLHVHIGPDVPPRRIDDLSLARRFAELGLAGFALKSHYTSTAERAQVVSAVVPDVEVVGTLTLNRAVGGMNALAVEIAAREGARIVWMPTVDSPAETAGRTEPKPGDKVPQWARLQHELRGLGLGVEPVHVTGEDGQLLPDTRDVLRAIARHGLILATAHLARDDAFAVVDGALEEGVEHIVVTHPEFPCQNFSIDDQVALAERGCLLERCLSTPHSGKTTWEHVVEGVRAVGVEQTLFSSDFGNPDYPAVEDGLALWADRLLGRGLRRGRGAGADRRPVATAGRSVSRKLLVVGAHSADFVWRAGGAIAVTTAGGGQARVLALSYGERGESGELWKEPDQTVERVKEIRHAEAERAAAALGPGIRVPRPRRLSARGRHEALGRLADRIRDFAPDVLVTHTDRDPFNPDHAVAFFAVERARALAAGGGCRERLRDRRAARASAVRAAPAGALQLRADDVRRHHAGDRAEAGGDGGDEGPGRTFSPTTSSAPSSAPTMRAARRATRRFATRRRSSA